MANSMVKPITPSPTTTELSMVGTIVSVLPLLVAEAMSSPVGMPRSTDA